jgi:GH15 family glucan-1,4-alpha-glucosidase
VRGGRRHFVYSKFTCWVALDRGLRLADKRSFPADRAVWLKARDAVYEEVMARGWSASRGSPAGDAVPSKRTTSGVAGFRDPMLEIGVGVSDRSTQTSRC